MSVATRDAVAPDIDALIGERLAALDSAALARTFSANDGMLALQGFLPAAVLDTLLARLPELATEVNRNYLPRHKKGGSVSRHVLDRLAPEYPALYRSPSLQRWLRRVVGRDFVECPPDDPHSYALYWYTRPGDHIGWHYDTSYYRGARYTVLIGLVDESSCRLEYELYRRRPDRSPVPGAVSLAPGMLVVFDGDRLWHRVTPSAAGERRIVLTLEYVTDPRMQPWQRFVSNMKDGLAYFGLRHVFRGR